MGGTCIPRHQILWAATAAASIPAQVRAAAKLPAVGGPPSTIPIFCFDTPILFDPEWVPGSSMDILSHDVVENIYTEPMVKQYSSAGWRARGPILATEAGISREVLKIRPNRALLRISSRRSRSQARTSASKSGPIHRTKPHRLRCFSL